MRLDFNDYWQAADKLSVQQQ